ncbi:MAG: sulfatase [Bacteroidota bacterium]
MKTWFLYIGWCFPMLLGAHGMYPQGELSDRPNIVILFCDDLGYGDLSGFGHPTIKTPNLDRMATEGMKFTSFYAASPKCSASRYALLTGRLPARTGFPAVLGPRQDLGIHPSERTLSEGLKKAGYATAIFGKWHLGRNREHLPLQNGFDEFTGLPYSNDMNSSERPLPLLQGNDTLALDPDQSQLTVLYTERAVDFIQRKKGRPFFVYIPYTMPHVPLHPGKTFAGKSIRGTYGDVVEEIDWSAGVIMEALTNLGLEKNTLVFFTSDNGPWLVKRERGGSAGLLRGGKGSTWEGGMRVPGIAWWPETVPKGHLAMEACNTMDLYVTALKLAGAALPEERRLDGRDIQAILTREEEMPGPKPFFYYPPRGTVHAVRKGPWKLHVQIQGKEHLAYFKEEELPLLFNLDSDPSETYNVAMAHPEVVQDLSYELNTHTQHLKDEITISYK